MSAAIIPWILLAIIVIALVIWGISYLTMIPANVRSVIIGCLILLVAYVLALKVGLI